MKDEDASTSVRKAAAITHKVLKHGILRLVEDSFDQAKQITHEELAIKAEEICEDPSKIKLNLPSGQLESCYFPIIQAPICVNLFSTLCKCHGFHRVVVNMTFGQRQPQTTNPFPMMLS